MSKLLKAADDTVVFLSVKNSLPLLGTVAHCESPKGTVFPVVQLAAKGYDLPVLMLAEDAPNSTLRMSLADFTYSAYFADPIHRQLANFYRDACKQYGWHLDNEATLTVVYYLSLNGICGVTNENLVLVMDLVQSIRKAYYDFMTLLAATKQVS